MGGVGGWFGFGEETEESLGGGGRFSKSLGFEDTALIVVECLMRPGIFGVDVSESMGPLQEAVGRWWTGSHQSDDLLSCCHRALICSQVSTVFLLLNR